MPINSRLKVIQIIGQTKHDSQRVHPAPKMVSRLPLPSPAKDGIELLAPIPLIRLKNFAFPTLQFFCNFLAPLFPQREGCMCLHGKTFWTFCPSLQFIVGQIRVQKPTLIVATSKMLHNTQSRDQCHQHSQQYYK